MVYAYCEAMQPVTCLFHFHAVQHTLTLFPYAPHKGNSLEAALPQTILCHTLSRVIHIKALPQQLSCYTSRQTTCMSWSSQTFHLLTLHINWNIKGALQIHCYPVLVPFCRDVSPALMCLAT